MIGRLHAFAWWLRQTADGAVRDNVTLNAGVGGVTCGTDSIGGVDFQRIKLIFGPDGTNSGDVSLANPLPTRQTAATSTNANVGESAASIAIVASNANRLGWSVYNDSDAALNINFGAAASASAFVRRLLPREFASHKDFGGTVYTGAINGIWDSTPGTAGHAAARVSELS